MADIRRPRYGAGGVNNAVAAIVRSNSAVPVICGREADKARAEMSVFTAALHHKFLPQIFGKILKSGRIYASTNSLFLNCKFICVFLCKVRFIKNCMQNKFYKNLHKI